MRLDNRILGTAPCNPVRKPLPLRYNRIRRSAPYRNRFSENFLLAKRARKRHDRPMTQHSPFEQTIASILRELEGGNKSPLTLTAYKAELTQFFQWLAENDVTVIHPKSMLIR